MSSASFNSSASGIVTATDTANGYVDWLEGGKTYRVRTLAWDDEERQAEYQRMRGDIFVKQLGWPIPIEPDGREVDRYDIAGEPHVAVHCVYGLDDFGREHLLAGLRIFTLRSWDDAMLTNEFASSGMIPPEVVSDLQARFAADELLELTRLCVRMRRQAPAGENTLAALAVPDFDLAIARDLIYASVVYQGVASGHDFTLAIMDSLATRALRRTHFLFEELYRADMHQRRGYTLALFNIGKCVHNIYLADGPVRAKRFNALCRPGAFAGLPY